MELSETLRTRSCWEVEEDRFDSEQIVTTGSTFMTGNGYLGYRGTFPDDRADAYTACILTDTYDNADGVWRELVNAPCADVVRVCVDGTARRWHDAAVDGTGYLRRLDFRYARWYGRATLDDGVSIATERVASAADIHLVISRTTIRAERDARIAIDVAIEPTVWDLNGRHLVDGMVRALGEELEYTARTSEYGYDVVVRQAAVVEVSSEAGCMEADSDARGACHGTVVHGEQGIVRRFEVDLAPGTEVHVELYAAYWSTNDLRSGANPQTTITKADVERAEPGTFAPGSPADLSRRADPNRPATEEVRDAAADTVARARRLGWEALLDEHRRVWDERWDRMDIEIDGDVYDQTILRYNLYHNIIATPMHTDHLPIGARGLSCQAYQGAAFWDQEIFNLPMFLFTEPAVARNILMYRYRTLNGARKKARELGFRGAYYAWISGDSGEEICPDYFFRDLVSGRRIRNHFNDWQIHVSPDIAYTVRRYVTVTGDSDFLRDYGAEIVFEVARFLVSRACHRRDTGEFGIHRVLGPDEYHENVDNNFFTNFQARFVARYAREVYEWMERTEPYALRTLAESIGLAPDEPELWTELADRLVVAQPDPDTRLIEQFDGFFRLEDVAPDQLRERLIDPGEYWGWPNGIAVATQVSKQADVVQLFSMHPQAYPVDVMRANWEYYEPRTQHGSSLSFAVYGIVAAWVGHAAEAHRYFRRSCTVDLLNTAKAISGGTFIGGIHTAACGAAWQLVVLGFAGMHMSQDGPAFAPVLPDSWNRVAFSIEWRGERRRVTIQRGADGTPVVEVEATG